MTIDLVQPIFPRGHPQFAPLVSEFRRRMLEAVAVSDLPELIFTYLGNVMKVKRWMEGRSTTWFVVGGITNLVLVGLVVIFALPSRSWRTDHIVLDLSFSPDGALLAVAETSAKRYSAGRKEEGQTTETHRARIRQVRNGRVMYTLGEHSDDVLAVAWSPDGQFLATASADQTVQVWHVRDERRVTTLAAERGEIISVTFSSDGQFLAAGTTNTVMLWNTRTWQRHHLFEGGGHVVKFSPDNQYLAGGSFNGLYLWRIRDNHDMMLPQDDWVRGITWSPESDMVAVSTSDDLGFDSKVRIWRITDHHVTTTLHPPGETYTFDTIAWSPNGRVLVAAVGELTRSHGYIPHDQGHFQVWDTENWQIRETVKAHQNNISTLTFSPDGHWVASGIDTQIRLTPIQTAPQ